MTRLKLKSIEMRNFGWVRQTSVDFPDSGLVLVTGHNALDADSVESIGTGKSLLGEALGRTLFNVPGRHTKLVEYSTHRAGNTYVKVEAILENQPFVVEMGYKCPELSRTGEGLRFTLGNQSPVMYGNILDTRAELTRIVGVTPDVAAWTVFIDGRKLDFSALSEAASVNLLMGVLNQPPWTEYQRKAALVASKFQVAVQTATGARDYAKNGITQLEVSLTAARQALEQARQKLQQDTAAWQQRQHQRQQKEHELTEVIAAHDSQLKQLKKAIELAVSQDAEANKEAELAEHKALALAREARVAQHKASQMYAQCLTKTLRLTSDKQQAITQYTRSEYARVNAERQRITAEADAASSHNAQVTNAWTTTESDLVNKLHSAQLRVTNQVHQVELAQLARDKEANVPCMCPLPGCGKPWPRTNQVQLAAAEAHLASVTTKLTQLKIAHDTAQAELQQHRATPPTLRPVPQIPAEQAIAPFPELATWDAAIETAKQEEAQAKETLAKAATAVDEADAAHRATQQKLADLKSASQVKSLSTQYERADANRRTLAENLAALKVDAAEDRVDSSAVTAAEATVAEKESSLATQREQHAKTLVEITECSEAHTAAQYWAEAFGPTGIPNMIVADAITPLNDMSRKVSMRMINGLLSVEYSTHRQLVSGKNKNELVITSKNAHGAGNVLGASKGEGGILNLIIAETLAEIGNMARRVGYRFYDEIAQSQDQRVRRSIFGYLKDLAQQLGILIFIVDHSVEVASYATATLTAEKTAAGTTYFWS